MINAWPQRAKAISSTENIKHDTQILYDIIITITCISLYLPYFSALYIMKIAHPLHPPINLSLLQNNVISYMVAFHFNMHFSQLLRCSLSVRITIKEHVN